jgi:hypothetical protein
VCDESRACENLEDRRSNGGSIARRRQGKVGFVVVVTLVSTLRLVAREVRTESRAKPRLSPNLVDINDVLFPLDPNQMTSTYISR